MSSLKENKTCAILEQYLSQLRLALATLTVIKGRSTLTADEYRIDNLMLFSFAKEKRKRLLHTYDFPQLRLAAVGACQYQHGTSGI